MLEPSVEVFSDMTQDLHGGLDCFSHDHITGPKFVMIADFVSLTSIRTHRPMTQQSAFSVLCLTFF